MAPATEIDKALEIDKQPTSGYEPQPKTQPANLLGVEEQPCSEPGSEPQLNAPFVMISEPHFNALLDMSKLFLIKGDLTPVAEAYALLKEETRDFLRAAQKQVDIELA